ncbi:MAG: right-handed parallel beta-helix repeat-containing protein, partial [Bacteroidota bacterium]
MNNLHNGLWARVRAFTCLLVMLSLTKAYAQKPTPGGNAYFTSAPIIYVNRAATGANTGTSWANAFTDLQSALKQARSTEGPDQIWVAKGTYKPTSGTNRKTSFTIPDKTALFGGFIGKEKSLKQRDWKTNETILNGNIGQGNISDNSFHVVSAFDLITGAWIDGFSVRNGYADGSSTARLGAGLLVLPTERGINNRMRIANCLFNANTAPNGSGGAIYGSNLFSEILDCTFRKNVAKGDGGAVMLSPGAGETHISRSYFTENNAVEEDGGAVAAFADLVEIDNSVFVKNAAQRGGGIYVGTNGALDMANATLVNNRTGADTGSSLHNRGKARVVSSIFFKDRQFPIFSQGQISVTYSNVHGGFPGTGNIDADPLYQNPSAGDFSLTTGSPSINTGNAVSLSGSFDILRNARIVDATIDMGAYEFLKEEEECGGARLYVDLTATGADNGSSWANAFIDLQDALATARKCQNVREIWVAEGSYKPTALSNRAVSFNLVNHVRVYGGFDGNETTLGQRDWVAHPTILSGDIPGENSYRVVLGSDLSSNTVLDGFIITESDMLSDGPSDPAIPFGEFGLGILLRASSGFTCTPIIKNCTFRSIRSRTGSGAMALLDANPTVDDCYFDDNYCEEGVGAIYATGNHVLRITDTYFYSNSGEFGSGAIEAEVDRLELENCVFEDNRSGDEDGGAIELMPNTDMRVVNSTFYANGTHTGRGAIFSFRSNNTVDIFNSIFWGNEDTDGNPQDPSDPNYYIIGDKSALTISYSIFEGGWPGVGNLDLDPQFASTGSSPANLRLQLTSPAINTGINTASTEPLDLDKNPRIANTTVDMGAYEFSGEDVECTGPILYVDLTATGADNGSSWTDAFLDLQDALATARVCEEVRQIWVAQGTYLPTSTTNRDIPFQLVNNVAVYGGFDGTETLLSQRDWVAHVTILSGDISPISDDSYHVVYGTNLNSNTVLDGFTIRDGDIDDAASSVYGLKGAGVLLTSSGTPTEPVFANLIITDNNVTNNDGGGMALLDANPSISFCTFLDNFGEIDGGGIYATGKHTLRITHSQFIDNSAYDYGGGIASEVGRLEIENCTFDDNYAETGGGGAIYTANGTILIVINSTFYGNRVDEGSGGALALGKTFLPTGTVSSRVINSIFWDNGRQPGAFAVDPGIVGHISGLSMSYTDYEGGWPGTGNIDVNPQFVFTASVPRNLRLQPTSPVINMGLNSASNEPLDLDRNPRIANTTVDMGAYEFTPEEIECGLTRLYVAISATGANNGSSWTDAFTDLQDALTYARVCENVREIWVAQGVYKPTPTLDKDISFELVSGVAMYGGFKGVETMLSQRDWVSYKSILSGDLDPTTGLTNFPGESYHVVVGTDLSNTTLFDGFTVEDGVIEAVFGTGVTVSNGFEGMGMVLQATSGASCEPVIRNSTFRRNYGYDGGATMALLEANPVIDYCRFEGNLTLEGPGAIYATGSHTLRVTNSYFFDNAGEFGSGAIETAVSRLEVENCVFDKNRSSDSDGGAIGVRQNTELSIINSTFHANETHTGRGAALGLWGNNKVEIANSIFWDNIDTDGNPSPGDPNYLIMGDKSQMAINYTIIQGGYAGTGNVNVNPQFISTAMPANLRLLPSSPGINTGLNAVSLEPLDLDRNARIFDGTIDRGAYEYSDNLPPTCPNDTIIYVNINAGGLNTGASWTDAFTDLQDALALASNCPKVREVWVAQGMYLPSQVQDPYETFGLLDNLRLYGGFKGGETAKSQRNWDLFPTILSGDLDLDGFSYVGGLNTYHILTAEGVEGAVVDGFIVENGLSDGTQMGVVPHGPGIIIIGTQVDPVQVSVNHSTFQGNYSYDDDGGAVFVENGEASFLDVWFVGNRGERSGGAVYSLGSLLTLSRCIFQSNVADDVDGGAIFASESKLLIDNSLFFNNFAEQSAGAIYASKSGLVISNTTFSQNGGGEFSPSPVSVGTCTEGEKVNSIF